MRPVDTWTYGYRSDGLRSSKQEAGSAPVEVSWDSSGGLPLLLAQHQGTAASYLVYGPGGTVIYQVRQDGSVLNLHHDHLGSTRLVTAGSNGSTYGTLTYDAYGRTTSDTTPWFLERPMVGYTGQYHDTETGLIYLRARHYHPSTGQFLTRDPIVELTQEPYGYASANPANKVDPTGLSTCGESSDFGLDMLGSLVDCVSKLPDAAEDVRAEVADVDVGSFDWGTLAAAGVNIGWGSAKVSTGVGAFGAATVALPVLPVSVPGYVYAVYQVGTGGPRFARGGGQLLSLTACDGEDDRRLGANAERFIKGIVPRFAYDLAGLP